MKELKRGAKWYRQRRLAKHYTPQNKRWGKITVTRIAEEESAQNRVRDNQLTEKEKGE